jgi:hypothetical protein
MKTILLVVVVLFALPVFAQAPKHVSTAAQCQAEEHLWRVEYEEWLGAKDQTKTTVNSLGIQEIVNRQIEMTDCTTIVFDSKPGQSTELMDPYLNISQAYANVEAHRYNRFLLRHHLMNQLWQEDAAGAR